MRRNVEFQRALDEERETIRKVLSMSIPELRDAVRVSGSAMATCTDDELVELDRRAVVVGEFFVACRGLIAAELEARRLRGGAR